MAKRTFIAFTREEIGKLGYLTGVIKSEIALGGDAQYIRDLGMLLRELEDKLGRVFQDEDPPTNEAIRKFRGEGWNAAKDEIRIIPCWYTDSENHGFDLWEDENGYAQESGARIEVMKILNNNPFSDNYEDPRAKRKPRGKRRLTSEE